jgi:hypothetical protein
MCRATSAARAGEACPQAVVGDDLVDPRDSLSSFVSNASPPPLSSASSASAPRGLM